MLIYVGYNITEKEKISMLVHRYMENSHKIRVENEEVLNNQRAFPKPFFKYLSKEKFNKYFKEYNFTYPDISYDILKKEAKLIAKDSTWAIYEYKSFFYFYRDDKFDTLFLKDTLKIRDKTIYFISLTLLLNITFLFFYIFLLKKLSPLNRLKTNIVKFSQGDLNINTSCEGKDEISQVSNEFNKAILEIKQLTQSRNLFLRNIMHELKTPITKGKLIGNLMEENSHKQMLKKVFERLEYLLSEFAKIEQITSKNIKLNKNSYRLIDILDQAIDILMIESNSLQIQAKHTCTIYVDFNLFSIVLKNLIDNAIKYGSTKPFILIEKNSIYIKSKGSKLQKDFQEYLKPFNRNYEDSSQSLGLGLYIVQSILKTHNLKLEYKYENSENIFFINFT